MDEAQELKRVRLRVERLNEPYMDVRLVGEDTLLRLDITVNHHTMRAAQLLHEGMQLNALSSELVGDVLRPQLMVIEPDFLLDTTSVTGCIKGWGESAFNHFIDKLLAFRLHFNNLLKAPAVFFFCHLVLCFKLF